MSTSIELVLLKCLRCSNPVPAEENEVAWVCANCGQGLQLAEAGLESLDVHWSEPRKPAAEWRPFWVFTGTVHFSERASYGGEEKLNPLWTEPRRFFVPAFSAGLNEIENLGGDFTRRQLALTGGAAAGPLQGCTLLPEDAERAVEFVVATIEADRRDKLRRLDFSLDLQPPELWMLPFEGGREPLNLIA